MLLPRIRLSSVTGRNTHPHLRKAVVAASAAALVLGPLAVTASADPAPAPSPAPASPALPADLAAAVQRDLKLSADEYLRRAGLAQQVAAFSTNAQQQYPDVFGGAWLDNAGKAVVALVPGPGQDAVRKAAQAVGFEVKDVAKTQTALRDEKNSFQQWLTGQPQDVAKSVRGAVIDVVNNTVAVRVDQAGLPMPGFVDPARVIVMAAPPRGPEPLQATAVAGEGGGPAAAGDAYASQAGHLSLRCSLGFNGIDGGGNVVNITAGHCDPNIPAAGTGDAPGVFDLLPGDHLGAQVGSFEKSVLGAQDYSIVGINDANQGRFSNNLVRAGQGPIPVTGVATPVVGAPVCKSGARTGFSCGVINAVDQTVEVGDHDLTQSFSANICALPGDSGGPVVSGTLALGISSASTVADFPVCEIPELLGVLTGNGPQLFVQPVDLVLADNPGLQVRTN